MFRVVEKKPIYLTEQPMARFVIKHDFENLKSYSDEEIFSKLSYSLADAIGKKMNVVRYIESPVTGAIYDGFYDYSPHTDPIGNIVYEAYLPKFNEMQARINYLEGELAKRKAYEEYYKK